MTDEPEPGPAAQFRAWAVAAGGSAAQCRAKSDGYGMRLAEHRAAVYRQAADMLAELDDADAAAEMISRASAAAVLTPPLVGFDRLGLRYITARAWQLCAQTLDPAAPTVQPEWP